jgi:hypothetical protein
MNLTNLLKGKLVKIMTDAKVMVELEIKEVKEEYHSRDLEPSTSANDWWPKSENWTTIEITFTNGYRKSYNNLQEINLVE